MNATIIPVARECLFSHASEWQMVRAETVMEFKNGLNFAAEQIGSGIPVVGVGDFGSDFRLPHRQFGRVDVSDGLDDSYYLKGDDLLFCRSNGNKALVGRVLFIDGIEEQTSHSGFTIRGRITSRQFLPLFAAYYFSSALVKEQFLTLGGGTNISNLSQNILKNVEVPLPPIPEQQKIAAILSTWDGAIELTEKLIAAKKKRKQALMQQLLTGKVRFRKFGRPASHGTPKGWSRATMSDGIELISGRHVPASDVSPNPYNTPYLTGPEDFVGGSVHVTKSVKNPDVLCNPGDILITVKGSGTGKSIRADAQYCISRQLMAVRSSKWDLGYLEHVVKASESRLNSAATGLIPGISRHDILEMPVLIPPICEQREITAFLGSSDEEIALLKKRRHQLHVQKKGLMQQLLTGKVRVNVDAEAVKG